jgi:KTSC domain
MVSRVLTTICLWLMLCSGAAAETVFVKYRGNVSLDRFTCMNIDRSSLVNRICYDAKELYMIILLKNTYYHYCEIGQGTIDELLAAQSMGKYFQSHIKGDGADGPFDCRTHRIPSYE